MNAKKGYETLSKELDKELPESLKTTEMFYFAAGQVTRHIYKKNWNRPYNKINALASAETSGELKQKILAAFKSHDVEQNTRFERAIALVMGGPDDEPMNEKTFILGYTTKSAF